MRERGGRRPLILEENEGWCGKPGKEMRDQGKGRGHQIDYPRTATATSLNIIAGGETCGSSNWEGERKSVVPPCGDKEVRENGKLEQNGKKKKTRNRERKKMRQGDFSVIQIRKGKKALDDEMASNCIVSPGSKKEKAGWGETVQYGEKSNREAPPARKRGTVNQTDAHKERGGSRLTS